MIPVSYTQIAPKDDFNESTLVLMLKYKHYRQLRSEFIDYLPPGEKRVGFWLLRTAIIRLDEFL